MKRLVCLLTVLMGVSANSAWAQARDIPSAAPTQMKGTPEEQGKRLLDEMVDALGGPAWLDRHNVQVWGRTAQFYQGQPNGVGIEYTGWRTISVSDAGGSGAHWISDRQEHDSAGEEDRCDSAMDQRTRL